MSGRSAGLRILSIEDDVINRALVRASLARADDDRLKSAELVEAATIAEARQALARYHFDLMLLDRRLPDGDGFTLAAEVRADAGAEAGGGAGAGARMVVLALTADAVPATREAAQAAGCDGLLTKPFAPHELTALIVDHLAAAPGAGSEPAG